MNCLNQLRISPNINLAIFPYQISCLVDLIGWFAIAQNFRKYIYNILSKEKERIYFCVEIYLRCLNRFKCKMNENFDAQVYNRMEETDDLRRLIDSTIDMHLKYIT